MRNFSLRHNLQDFVTGLNTLPREIIFQLILWGIFSLFNFKRYMCLNLILKTDDGIYIKFLGSWITKIATFHVCIWKWLVNPIQMYVWLSSNKITWWFRSWDNNQMYIIVRAAKGLIIIIHNLLDIKCAHNYFDKIPLKLVIPDHLTSFN